MTTADINSRQAGVRADLARTCYLTERDMIALPRNSAAFREAEAAHWQARRALAGLAGKAVQS